MRWWVKGNKRKVLEGENVIKVHYDYSVTPPIISLIQLIKIKIILKKNDGQYILYLIDLIYLK
jgi:hypothetical protein